MEGDNTIHTGPERFIPASMGLDAIVRCGLYVHALPGRLRIEAPALRSDPTLGALLKARVSCAAGVTGVEINSLTGRILIKFDPDRITEDEIAVLLHRAGCFPAAVGEMMDGANGAMHPAAQVLAKLAAEELARHTIQWIFTSLL